MKTLLTILSLSISLLRGQPSSYPLSIGPPSPVQSGSTRLVGPGGSSSYSYYVIAVYPVGNATPSVPITIFNAPSNLTMSNNIVITWQPLAGVSSYTLLRYLSTTRPPLPITCSACKVADGITSNTFTNNSNTLTSYTLNTTPGAKVSLTMNNGPSSTPTLDINSPTNQVITVQCISPVTGPVCNTGGGGGGGNPVGGVGAIQLEGSPTTFNGDNTLLIGNLTTVLNNTDPLAEVTINNTVIPIEDWSSNSIQGLNITFNVGPGSGSLPGGVVAGASITSDYSGSGNINQGQGLLTEIVFTPSDGSSNANALYSLGAFSLAITSGTIDAIYGVDLSPNISGGGTVTLSVGGWAEQTISDMGTSVGTNYGFLVSTPTLSSGAAITTKNVAFFNENQTGIAGDGKDFAWYSEGGTNHLETGDAGSVGLEIERHTAQTADMFRFLDSDGTTVLAHWDSAASLFLNATNRTPGAATGKKVLCVDTTTGGLFASSTGTDCSN